MLRDIRELGKDLKTGFAEIKRWPEISFNQKDKQMLSGLTGASEINDHSITFKSSDNNITIIPSQYILYAVYLKEFALALRDHMDIFDQFKSGKSQEETGRLFTNNAYNISDLNLDPWSSFLAIKMITDLKTEFDAKDIINGAEGKYKVRGSSDFFGSVILKIIDVPDSSSGILGKLIYDLSGKKEIYNYLGKRFFDNLPFLIKDNNINGFAYKVTSYLYQYDQLERIKNLISANENIKFKSIKSNGVSLTSIFRVSNTLLTTDDLSTGGKPRYFVQPLCYNEQNEFVYFSTEWTAGRDSRLDLDDFEKILSNYYPEFKMEKKDSTYIFKATNAPKEFSNIQQVEFECNSFIDVVNRSGLFYSEKLIIRLISSLITKPFVILTGLSGSGKTKLAQVFVNWICENESQYCIVPVGADWTNREPLLGYPNALDTQNYVKPDNGALDLIINANKNPELPHFLILDEMNLSHVERYFADFLSTMESKCDIPLFAQGSERNDVPPTLHLPDNLFIVGTVNIDETTYMFSPKVLDRANTIEFRIEKKEMDIFLKGLSQIDMNKITGKGTSMSKSFLKLAQNKELSVDNGTNNVLLNFFDQLKKCGAEFGYRSATEIIRLVYNLNLLNSQFTEDDKIDIAIVQKLLPKLHGSRRKICPVLKNLGAFCITDKIPDIEKDIFEKDDFDFNNQSLVKYPVSLEKIYRMYRGALENGFTSYAEA